MSTDTRPVGSKTRVCTRPISSTTHVCTRTICTTTCISLLSYLGFSLQDTLRSSAAFNHIHFCLSFSNLNHNQSQHIQVLQKLTYASQPYSMNATKSCIRNQYTIAIISVLNYESVSHSINQHKPNHNNHTKNALRIHHTTSKSIHQENYVTIPFESMHRSNVSEHCRPS
jgi:hypothetical protein